MVMTQLTSINQAWQINLLFGAGLGVVQVLRWLWWRMNAWAEIAAMVVSAAVAPILLSAFGDEQQALRLLLIAAAATAAALLAVWIKGPEDRAGLTEFYRRVRPVGFWGPIAVELGETVEASAGPRRLARALGAMALCSVTVFCLLVGIGTWLVGSPFPDWLPSRASWVGILLFVAVACCPLWYRLGFGGLGLSERGPR
jgi:hypothetical protein